MSTGARLLITGSQSLIVHPTAPVMTLLVLSSCTSKRWYVHSSSKLEHSAQPQSNRGPRQMYEEFLHLHAPHVTPASMCTELATIMSNYSRLIVPVKKLEFPP